MSFVLPYEFIAEKQTGASHAPDSIKQFIDGYMNGDIQDYQMSAWLMAVFFKGMTTSETASLTEAMIDSGDRVVHEAISTTLGDKHSTGGVGDKITLLLAPLVAASGVPVPTVSGRGLGFTGGTLDKLESIPGMRTDLSIERLKELVAQYALAFGAQTTELVPADRRMYALRDVTSTIHSYPLITSSILSKKAAEGIQSIVYDVKCGYGAFMQSEEEATELSRWLVKVSDHFGLKSAALVTDMNSPLGYSVGNWLEVEESIRGLKNEHIEPDIRELTLSLGGTLLALAKKAATTSEGMRIIEDNWQNLNGYKLFKDVIAAQGGDVSVFDSSIPPHVAGDTFELKAEASGSISKIHAREIGFSCVELGAGRKRTDDKINPATGMIFHKHLGDTVRKDDTILTLHTANKADRERILPRIRNAIEIQREPFQRPALIKRVITSNGDYNWNDFKEMQIWPTTW